MVSTKEAYEIVEREERINAIEQAVGIIWQYLDMDKHISDKQDKVEKTSKKISEDLKEVKISEGISEDTKKKMHDLN